ncbi:MAG: ATP-binding protein [bacterium]
MDKNEIINVLEDWNFWKKNPDTGIIRDSYLERLKRFSQSGQVVAIIGPRRSGKSYIMRQFAQSLIGQGVNRNNILIVNFEDPRFPELNAKTLGQIFDAYLEFLSPQGELYVFLDEVQEVSGWEKWVRSMQELKKAQIVISGSNARLLSQELATVLTGRHLNITVFPLSFREYLLFNKIELRDSLDIVHHAVSIKGLFRKYLEFGSYPEVALKGMGREILSSYFDDILNRDLIRRYKIRKGEKLESLAKFYLSQIASLTTYNSAAKFLDISTDTVEKFSSYLKTAYLLFFLKRFSYKLKEQEKSPRKVYAIDTGLANAVGFSFSENRGRAAENMVFLELLRSQAVNPALEIYFWKDIHHREVDFVLKQGLKVEQLIQVCWDTAYPKTKERETRTLFKTMGKFGLPGSLIITEDQESEEKINGKNITFKPLWKWLLEKDI